jgi:hypothetical protein
MRRVLACAAALYRMLLIPVQGRVPAIRIGERLMRQKHRRPPSHRAAAEQFDLFGLLDAKHPTLVEVEWRQLPEETRETVTRLMARLLVDHRRGDLRPSSAERRHDV